MQYFSKKTAQITQGHAAHPSYSYAQTLILGVANEFKN